MVPDISDKAYSNCTDEEGGMREPSWLRKILYLNVDGKNTSIYVWKIS
jgi:hypothetical protein